jgi:hypothetical protein
MDIALDTGRPGPAASGSSTRWNADANSSVTMSEAIIVRMKIASPLCTLSPCRRRGRRTSRRYSSHDTAPSTNSANASCDSA